MCRLDLEYLEHLDVSDLILTFGLNDWITQKKENSHRAFIYLIPFLGEAVTVENLQVRRHVSLVISIENNLFLLKKTPLISCKGNCEANNHWASIEKAKGTPFMFNILSPSEASATILKAASYLPTHYH